MEVNYLGKIVGVRKLKKINMEDKKAHWKVRAIQTKGEGYLLQHYLQGQNIRENLNRNQEEWNHATIKKNKALSTY